MAEKKRGPGRPPGSKNKNKTKSSEKVNEKPKTKGEQIDEMQEKRKHDRKVADEIWAVTLFALGIFFIFTIWLDSTGAFGAMVHDLCLGLFGIMAYVLPVYFFVSATLLFLQKVQHITLRTTLFSCLIFIMLCVLNSYRFIDIENIKFGFSDIAYYYTQGVEGNLGGCIGMELGSLLVKFLGKPGLIIVAVAVIIISLLLVINTPMSKGLSNYLDKREKKKLLTEMQEIEARRNLDMQRTSPAVNTSSKFPYGEGDTVPETISKQDAIDRRYTMLNPDGGSEPLNNGITQTDSVNADKQQLPYSQAHKQTGLFSFLRPEKPVDKAKELENQRKIIELAGDRESLNVGSAAISDSIEGYGLSGEAKSFGGYGLDGESTFNSGFREPERNTGLGLGDYDLEYFLDPADRREKLQSYTASGIVNSSDYREPGSRNTLSRYSSYSKNRTKNTGSTVKTDTYRADIPSYKADPSIATELAGTALSANIIDNAASIIDDVISAPVGAVTSASAIASAKNSKPNETIKKKIKEEISETDDFANEISAAFNTQEDSSSYQLPPTSLLKSPNKSAHGLTDIQLQHKAELLEKTLSDFGVDAKVINVTQGASVTRYEVQPATGVKVSKITGLSDDIALNLRARSIRIEAPIPGKAAVGIEVENDKPAPVLIRELIESPEFINAKSKLSFVVGKDISGNNVVADLKQMPHLLIAGTTGSGKSVCINSIITSFLYKAKPSELKMIMIDPKVVELGNYNGIPHMLSSVVTDPRKASRALGEAVAEMNKRYEEFAKVGVKDLESYNELMIANQEPQNCKPEIVIIIDELADLMMAAPSQVEESICRLAQKARAAGMHLIVATQRPSVDVVTGLIKANISSRIAFSVASQIDSRTILDMGGAEKLLGKGDMLFSPIGSSKPFRVQGPYISEAETSRVIDYVKRQAEPEYDKELIDAIEGTGDTKKNNVSDDLTDDAIAFILKSKQASVSMLQRRFRIGYNRAARIIDEIEAMGIIGPSDGSRPRQVLITEDEYYGRTDELSDEMLDNEPEAYSNNTVEVNDSERNDYDDSHYAAEELIDD